MKKVVKYMLFLILINTVVTSTIDRFKHTDFTETKLMIRLPQVFFWNFK